ncbi:hypothetical protein N7509_011297 [Penicillium cosmopolitanum]|uniref:Xylanolytic transcriptional activator regulatory domain-containing protein n=1 Tax=Penicillium cosmopolitanum TaxID=1131564 RepID=A0A9W9VSX7_9EURO|nr:uncharacterized protein N7509_011297 [Penicillium cosmopolitanum]KAJ5388756.1 hypothetical protein N7509_011297 [Penicillium cosmopolitanum]
MWQNINLDCTLDMQDMLLPDEIVWLDHIQTTESTLSLAAAGNGPLSHLMHSQTGESTALSRLSSPEILDPPDVRDVMQTVCNYTISEERWVSIEDELAQHQLSLPSRKRLSQFVNRYFHSFHSHQPFIHMSTWSPNTSNSTLLLAICACGAQYSLESEVASQLLKAAIYRLPYQAQDIQVLQALMILSAGTAWSGSPEMLKIALDYYGKMAMMLRSGWNRSRQDNHEQPPSWERWIEMESLRR